MPAYATSASWVLETVARLLQHKRQAGAATFIAVPPTVLATVLTIALTFTACTSVAPPAPGGSATAAPTTDARAAAPAALAAERQWLQSWFKDTPVRIAQRSDGAVTVDVPLEFCFDAGRSTVKPALAAVLDKVAESMRRVPAMRLPLLAAPDGAPGTAPLAIQRAAQVHKHLLNRGVAAVRLGPLSTSPVAAVQLRLEAAPPA